jgi:hypothetical protein
MTIVYLLLISCICACLYRMGGCGPADLLKEWGWVPAPIRNFPKKRDVGCGVVTLGACALIGISAPWYFWLLAFGLMWASLSTYWDFLFGFDNHWFHGFVIGMSLLPVVWGDWQGLAAYALGLAGLMGLWSKLIGNATWEELGRGFVMPATLGLLLWL